MFSSRRLPWYCVVLLAITVVSVGARVEAATSLALPLAGQIKQAAVNGPHALIESLRAALGSHPEVAASPQAAAELARVAAEQVLRFRGANAPVYRNIVAAIVAAAPAATRKEVGRAVGEAVGAVASTDPSLNRTITFPLPPQAKGAPSEGEGAAQPYGVKVGSFLLYSEPQVSFFYDDNIYATGSQRAHDFVTVLSPSVYLQSMWAKNAVTAQAHADYVSYGSHNYETTTSYWLSGEGRYDLGGGSNIFGGVLHGRFHEDRESPDDLNGVKPTRYSDSRAYGGTVQQLGKMRVRLGMTAERLNFKDTYTPLGPINNDDRDRNVYTAGLRIGYGVRQGLEPFVEFTGNMRRYNSAVDDIGLNHDSSGYRAMLGVSFAPSSALEGELALGYLRQNYRDPLMADDSAPAFSGFLRWRATDSTRVYAWIDRTVEETTLFFSSSYIYSGGGLTVEHDLTERLMLTGRGSMGRSEFQTIGRRDDDYDMSAGLHYRITGNWYVAGDYRYQLRHTTAAGLSYHRNQVFLRVGTRF